MINGNTELLAHIGHPTHTFRAPLILNPYFDANGIDAVVVPMGCRAGDYPAFLRSVFTLTNIRGALITMPHKRTTVGLVDEVSPAVRIAGACNAVRREPGGRLRGEQFDGAGFVRGLARKGFGCRGARALVVGCGGVGSAIAAALAAAGVARMTLSDAQPALADELAQRVQAYHPAVRIDTGPCDPSGHDLVVNATPMGMNDDDPLPLDVARIPSAAVVGDVVLRRDDTAFLRAARARGCTVQVGADMLFEQLPAYLAFFGFPETDAETLRRLAHPAPVQAGPAKE